MGVKIDPKKASAVKIAKIVKSAQEKMRPTVRINGHGLKRWEIVALSQSSNDLRRPHQLRTRSVSADPNASSKIQMNCLKYVLEQK